jgi:hypothetical protein
MNGALKYILIAQNHKNWSLLVKYKNKSNKYNNNKLNRETGRENRCFLTIPSLSHELLYSPTSKVFVFISIIVVCLLYSIHSYYQLS